MPIRLDVQRHEWFPVVVGSLYFFAILCAYYVLRPIREQLSAAVGSTSLPIFYAVTFAVTLILSPLFGALVARFPRRVFLPVVYAFFILGMLAFIPLFRMQDTIGAQVLGPVFFVWVSVFNLFVVAVFWSFMADLLDPKQAHRLFPIIALGGAAGAIVGPLLTRSFVDAGFGVGTLLVVSCLLLGFAIAAIALLSRWSRAHPVAGEAREHRVIGGSFLAGARETLLSPLMRRLALLLLLGDAVGTVVYALLADYNGAVNATREARIAFSANIDLYTNVTQAVLQIVLTRPLMTRFGPVVPMVLDGVVKAVMLAGLALFGSPWIAVMAVVTRASAYGIFKPALDAVYANVDAETRYKTKNFIDTAVWRFGDLVVTLGFNGVKAGTAKIAAATAIAGLFTPVIAGIGVLAAVGSAWTGWSVGRLVAGHRSGARKDAHAA